MFQDVEQPTAGMYVCLHETQPHSAACKLDPRQGACRSAWSLKRQSRKQHAWAWLSTCHFSDDMQLGPVLSVPSYREGL